MNFPFPEILKDNKSLQLTPTSGFAVVGAAELGVRISLIELIQSKEVEMVTAADIMTREVVTTQAEAPLREALFKLVQDKISGLPVVNQENEMVGIVARRDLLREVSRFYGQK